VSPGLVFERVYHALKAELGSDRLAAGAPLEPGLIAQNLNASITPVRDALHRLVGEGLVEAPQGDGFRTPMVTEVGLRDLYRWHHMLLELAIRGAARRGAIAPASVILGESVGEEDALIARTELVFLAIASLAQNAEHPAAVHRLGERLRRSRQAERLLIADGAQELEILTVAGRGADIPDLRQALSAYHRRRERLTPQIVACLHKQN
jgi:DNA-binding transcriptional MocR family regulator